MNISVVSSSLEFFSLWHGGTAWEIEMTLLDCTSLALHSHTLKLFALPFHVGIRGGALGASSLGRAGTCPREKRGAECVSRSSHFSFFIDPPQ